MKKKFETRAIHVGQNPEELYGSVSLPLYQTSTFKQEEFGEYTYDYSRAGNPTRNALEETIASLEGGSDAAMFGSGMAAMSAMLHPAARSGRTTSTRIPSRWATFSGLFARMSAVSAIKWTPQKTIQRQSLFSAAILLSW